MEKPISRLMSPYLKETKMSALGPISEHLMKPLPLQEIQEYNLLIQDFVVLGV